MVPSFGHEPIISFFERCIENRTLHHAYAFFGPTHVGKRTVAEEISRTLLRIPMAGALVHPDLIVIEREIDEKTGLRKKDISVTQIRDLIHRLHQSSFEKDGYTIAIIDGAEYLNPAGANALLKTLEEPRSRTVIFLITQDESLLLPTIRSRVQSLYFSLVSQEKILLHLEKCGVDSAQAQIFSKESHGLPGYACTWAMQPGLYDIYRSEKERCLSLTNFQFHEKIQRIEDLFEDTDDHVEVRTKIIETLRVWTIALRDSMIESENLRTRIFPVLDSIREAERELKRNVHPRLILEHIMLALPHI